ncbi:hypothetical protein T02_16475 [Trichinella nativa]|uniref:Uncharacterized protein n=1 Tax=Trichinella nativa TaxID=6335 RepID=A0A0V1KLS4_9BILA|nr:hypothetical protein T02_16475 [Trichinella nativa]
MDFSEETMQGIHRETLTEDGSPPSEDIRFWVIPKFSPLQLLLNMTILNIGKFSIGRVCRGCEVSSKGKLMLNMALRLKIAKSAVKSVRSDKAFTIDT